MSVWICCGNLLQLPRNICRAGMRLGLISDTWSHPTRHVWTPSLQTWARNSSDFGEFPPLWGALDGNKEFYFGRNAMETRQCCWKNPSQLYLVSLRFVLWGLCRGWSSKQIISLIPSFQILCLKLFLFNFLLSWDCICKKKLQFVPGSAAAFWSSLLFSLFHLQTEAGWALGLQNSGSFLGFISQSPLFFIFQSPVSHFPESSAFHFPDSSAFHFSRILHGMAITWKKLE